MDRMTFNMLEKRVDYLNKITGNPLTPYSRDKDQKYIGHYPFRANIGNYHLSGAYGGHSLHQMVCAEGGVRDVLSCGHIPKRELFNRINAYIQAIRDTSN